MVVVVVVCRGGGGGSGGSGGGSSNRPGKSWKMTMVMKSHGIPPIGHGIC